MRILITNDDGIDSPGIAALVDVLCDRTRSVFVVAPSGESQRRLTRHHDAYEAITMERRNDCAVLSYACSGTPADCVFLGATELSLAPDAVVSGINHGPNLADDVNYSGTVAGAIEACLLGIPRRSPSRLPPITKSRSRSVIGRARPPSCGTASTTSSERSPIPRAIGTLTSPTYRLSRLRACA